MIFASLLLGFIALFGFVAKGAMQFAAYANWIRDRMAAHRDRYFTREERNKGIEWMRDCLMRPIQNRGYSNSNLKRQLIRYDSAGNAHLFAGQAEAVGFPWPAIYALVYHQVGNDQNWPEIEAQLEDFAWNFTRYFNQETARNVPGARFYNPDPVLRGGFQNIEITEHLRVYLDRLVIALRKNPSPENVKEALNEFGICDEDGNRGDAFRERPSRSTGKTDKNMGQDYGASFSNKRDGTGRPIRG
jgi:hypothetical protein